MGALGTPMHLLPFCKALGDDVIHSRFDKARADSISLAIALAVVGDECLIVGNIRVEFFNRSQQLASRRVFIFLNSRVQIHLQGIHVLECFIRYYRARDTI